MEACQSPSKIARDIANKRRPAGGEGEAPAPGAYIPRAYLQRKAAAGEQ
jgi:hypothetical protein